MLMGTNDSAVYEMERPVQPPLRIGLSLEVGQDANPQSGSRPAIEAGRDRLPGTVAFGEGAPRTSRAQDPKDAVEDGPMIIGGSSRARLLRREQGTQPFPLRLGQVA
jgi:hypothetical protein